MARAEAIDVTIPQLFAETGRDMPGVLENWSTRFASQEQARPSAHLFLNSA